MIVDFPYVFRGGEGGERKKGDRKKERDREKKKEKVGYLDLGFPEMKKKNHDEKTPFSMQICPSVAPPVVPSVIHALMHAECSRPPKQ